MSYDRHHAIIVTTYKLEFIKQAVLIAHYLFPRQMISSITDDIANGWYSFMIGPDGSKEGWETSIACDAKRAEFIQWLNSRRYVDKSSPFDWVEIQYGDDNKETKVVRHSDE